MTVDEMASRAGALVAAHWEEIDRHKERPEAAPDWPRYRRLEASGVLIVLGVFDGPTMIGYSASAVIPDLHYEGQRVCANDAIFVDSAFRGRGIGARLMRETEAYGRELGAHRVTFHANVGSGFQDLLQRLGYGAEAMIYGRRLDG